MDELLDQYFSGTISAADKARLFRRIESDPGLRDEYARLQNTIGIAGMLPDDNDDAYARSGYEELMNRAGARRMRRRMLSAAKYAAAAALIVLASWFSGEYALRGLSDEFILVEAPTGHRVHLTLADGTEAWLSSRTRLRAPGRFGRGKRVVDLYGEALFSVAPDKDRPFIVQTSVYDIEVTGTQFNVFSYPESSMFEIDLLEGTVLVSDRARPDVSMQLRPNEKAYAEEGKLIKSFSSFVHSHYIKDGIYNFENQTLKELCRRLELWYNLSITITKEEMELYAFSGKFRQSDSIARILQAIKETGKFNYRMINDRLIEIY